LRPIGIFGGTFDPIHFGHLRMAEELREKLDLDQVHFVPAAIPPHRAMPHGDSRHRATMVELATAGNPGFSVDMRELRRVGPSYTFDTLTELRSELGSDAPLCLMIGSDAFLGLPSWHRWQELTDLAHIVVAHRPGAIPTAMSPELKIHWREHRVENFATLHATPAGAILLQPITALDISASAIRATLAQGGSTRYLMPEAVRAYIDSHHLYAPAARKEEHGT
jgi:nicotinate-nucleotide adenylyltransferase